MSDPSTSGFDAHPDRESARITDLSFRKQKWQSQAALVSKDGGCRRPYTPGDEFDAELRAVVPDAWDHEHCDICNNHICSYESHGFPAAYINDSGVGLCPPCFAHYFAAKTAAPDGSNCS